MNTTTNNPKSWKGDMMTSDLVNRNIQHHIPLRQTKLVH
jgi:hypothetical protein